MTDDHAKAERAYDNQSFLRSTDARPLRILAEYLEPQRRFELQGIEDTIVFFGSARIPPRGEAEAELAAARKGQGDLTRAEQRYELSVYYEATRELARRLTEWSKGLSGSEKRFVVCSGGGPGIMEAANRGASEAKGINVALNISIPFEQHFNKHATRELLFEFHYFFMRKFWFTYLAKAVMVMPGGFGTLDELFELLTLVQTSKIRKHMPIVLFGSRYWADVIDFKALARYGSISPEDIDLFFRTDSVDEAFDFITEQLSAYALGSPGASL